MTNLLICQIGLTMIKGVGDILARQLLRTTGDVEAIFAEKERVLEKIPGIGSAIAREIRRPEILDQARKEAEFVEKSGITTYFITQDNYPIRLRECPDAPVLFYMKGDTDLNAQHIISVVGTRKASSYGFELTDLLMDELGRSLPDTLIVSGLAYGIDIRAHKAALRNGMPTVAVLAHGLDRIYPSAHRNTAIQMLDRGGLVTDFASGTEPDRSNFVMRNRIVAGLADATVVVESAEHGGSLITADIAFSYGRDVYTFPGRITDSQSKGCNALIRQNKAALITSAEDLISAMRWDVPDKPANSAKQTELSFLDTDDSPAINKLQEYGGEAHINQLALALDIPISELTSLLFELEMNGTIKSLPGNYYKLIR